MAGKKNAPGERPIQVVIYVQPDRLDAMDELVGSGSRNAWVNEAIQQRLDKEAKAAKRLESKALAGATAD